MYRFRSPLVCGTLSFLASVTEWKPVTVRDLLVSNKIYHIWSQEPELESELAELCLEN